MGVMQAPQPHVMSTAGAADDAMQTTETKSFGFRAQRLSRPCASIGVIMDVTSLVFFSFTRFPVVFTTELRHTSSTCSFQYLGFSSGFYHRTPSLLHEPS